MSGRLSDRVALSSWDEMYAVLCSRSLVSRSLLIVRSGQNTRGISVASMSSLGSNPLAVSMSGRRSTQRDGHCSWRVCLRRAFALCRMAAHRACSRETKPFLMKGMSFGSARGRPVYGIILFAANGAHRSPTALCREVNSRQAVDRSVRSVPPGCCSEPYWGDGRRSPGSHGRPLAAVLAQLPIHANIMTATQQFARSRSGLTSVAPDGGGAIKSRRW